MTFSDEALTVFLKNMCNILFSNQKKTFFKNKKTFISLEIFKNVILQNVVIIIIKGNTISYC